MENGKVDVSSTIFDSAITEIQWLKRDASVVLVLTAEGRLWRSGNSGRTFTEQTRDLVKARDALPRDAALLNSGKSSPGKKGERTEKGKQAGSRASVVPLVLESLTIHPANNSTVLAQTRGLQHFISEDAGQNWRVFEPQMQLHNFLFHPFRPGHALYSTWGEGCESARGGRGKVSAGKLAKPGTRTSLDKCNHQLYLTKDLGKTSRKVSDLVVQYNWGDKREKAHADQIYFTAHRHLSNGVLGQPRFGGWHETVDLFESSDWGKSRSVVLRGGNKFLVSKNFIFVAQLDDYAQQTVNLMISNDWGRKFRKATIPTKLKEKSYTILDTSEGGVMIHVNHGSSSPGLLEGNVYVSDTTGTRFSLSLVNNIRAPTGECEFDRVLGVDGVYLANVRVPTLADTTAGGATVAGRLSAEAELLERETLGDALAMRRGSGAVSKASGSGSRKPGEKPRIRTVISMDKGGQWQYLKPPAKDSRGKPVVCEDSTQCYLHLHGITHFDRYAPFYSVESALGIIMGTGNVGAALSRETSDINTYISRDAGLSWHEAHKGAFIYEYGDHGGLIVMANDAAATNQVVFSWNEGHSWYDFNLGMSGVSVDNVVIEPSSSGLEFLLYGSTRGGKGVIFHMDFVTLGQSRCSGQDSPDSLSSDYEFWVPGDALGSRCLLGRSIKYMRRRVTSECYNGRDFSRTKVKETCACTDKDFECEVGFYRSVGDGNACVPSPYEDRDYMTVEGCTSSGIYYTHAYRKVPGDECVNGFLPQKVPVPCPPSSPLAQQAKATLALMLLVGFSIAAVSYAARHPVLRKYISHSGFDTFVEVGYSVVGRATESVQKGGEELFNFWTATDSRPTQFTSQFNPQVTPHFYTQNNHSHPHQMSPPPNPHNPHPSHSSHPPQFNAPYSSPGSNGPGGPSLSQAQPQFSQTNRPLSPDRQPSPGHANGLNNDGVSGGGQLELNAATPKQHRSNAAIPPFNAIHFNPTNGNSNLT